MPNYPERKIKKERKPFENKPVERSGEYNTRAWQKLRMSILMDEPLCRKCKINAASVVDHIKPVRQGGEFWERDNLQPLCKWCHNSKSGKENNLTGKGGKNPNT